MIQIGVLKNQQRLRLHFGTDEVLARATIKKKSLRKEIVGILFSHLNH